MAMEFSHGRTVFANMKDNGHKTKCMEKEYITGMMVVDTKEAICMIKRKDLVNTLGQMEGCTVAIGSKESNMVLAS